MLPLFLLIPPEDQEVEEEEDYEKVKYITLNTFIHLPTPYTYSGYFKWLNKL